jgi:NAD(P)-dependent dehydrogenase (short-subunit alcohol dehydrogenase family)
LNLKSSFRLVATRRPEDAEATAAALGATVGAVALDLSDPKEARSNARSIDDRHGPVDILENNAACPGWVRTRMGGAAAPRSVAEGADTPIWLATIPDDGPTGGFFRDRRRIEW